MVWLRYFRYFRLFRFSPPDICDQVEIAALVCDLCGAAGPTYVLSTERLDGPLVTCRACGLFYVAPPSREPGAVSAEMVRLAGRAQELALVERDVEEGERPWRERMARERLADLGRFVPGGRLLEIGSSTGEMIAAAGERFTAIGLEPDEANCRIARARGLDCRNTTLDEARFPAGHFDAAVSYHVIEHVPSPRAELRELHRVLKPGGWLVMETPNIDNLWYRLLGARWRQFIPDHLYFFTPQTFTRLCEESGFEVRELRSVGKSMSLRLFLNRLGRLHAPTAALLRGACERLGLADRTLRLNLGDVMRVYATRRASSPTAQPPSANAA
ncbi:MAG: class I SAM-dependent methyltransferase [Blastocatellia bacterium]|nr:class I SAM-dependent methyltransferase [Blastocatellia bacterium]